MSKKYKVLMVVLMTLLLIISFCSTCFGAFEFSYNGTDYSITDLPVDSSENKIIIGRSSNQKDFVLFVSLDGSDFIYKNSDSARCDGRLEIYNYSSFTKGWTKSTSVDCSDSNYKGSYFTLGELVYNNCNVYNPSGELVFQGPPQQGEGILVLIVQETPLEGILQEIVEILPIVLVTIVGLISLRKGLAFLLRTLHQS